MASEENSEQEEKHLEGVENVYVRKPYTIRLQAEDIIQIHSLPPNHTLNYVNNSNAKITSFDAKTGKYIIRLHNRWSGNAGMDITLTQENLKPIFIRDFQPSNGRASCMVCDSNFIHGTGKYICNTCPECMVPALCNNPMCRMIYGFKHNLPGDGLCEQYQTCSELEIDSILNYSLCKTFEFESIITKGFAHEVLNQFKFSVASESDEVHQFNGIHNKGIWLRMCGCLKIPYGELLETVKKHEHIVDPFWCLPADYLPRFEEITSCTDENGADEHMSVHADDGTKVPSPKLKNWLDYYKLRKLPLRSPVAHFMSWPLTLYFALTEYLDLAKIQLKDMSQQADEYHGKPTIIIHVVGCEIEFDLLHIFEEIAYLMPRFSFHFVMFGYDNQVSNKLNSKFDRSCLANSPVVFDKIKMQYCEENINDIFVDTMKHLKQPDLLIGFNAGFEAYDEWRKVINYMKKNRILSVFTEYTSATCASARQLAQQCGTDLSVKMKINPFRSCFVECGGGSKLTSTRNGWIYTINTSNDDS